MHKYSRLLLLAFSVALCVSCVVSSVAAAGFTPSPDAFGFYGKGSFGFETVGPEFGIYGGLIIDGDLTSSVQCFVDDYSVDDNGFSIRYHITGLNNSKAYRVYIPFALPVSNSTLKITTGSILPVRITDYRVEKLNDMTTYPVICDTQFTAAPNDDTAISFALPSGSECVITVKFTDGDSTLGLFAKIRRIFNSLSAPLDLSGPISDFLGVLSDALTAVADFLSLPLVSDIFAISAAGFVFFLLLKTLIA